MSPRYADNDRYTYDDSPVQINKQGIRDATRLKLVETAMGFIRSLQAPPAGSFDAAHLKAIHHHIFQDIYDWAGEFRDVHICLGNSPFAAPQFIEQSLPPCWPIWPKKSALKTHHGMPLPSGQRTM